ncbi:MAG: sugar transferase [Candidatus Marinimicrobia bacterium]|nr:sugar transferase [bacterium]MCG2715322.1 sugar transferase [Candidatus Neomarinimicrobiota bacterium]
MVQKNETALFIKFTFDKIVAVVLLIITSPIFLWVAIHLKIMGEDVFYLQKRVGYLGQDFLTYKFTTMPKGSEKLGLITTKNDERPFKFGKFMRKTKINELPQLINVLKGEMSFIGPRPLLRSQISEVLSDAEIVEYYLMRPGITGAGSLCYHHEDALLAEVDDPHQYYREVIIPKKFDLEKEYAANWNLVLDLKILLKTFIVLVIPTCCQKD